MRITFVSALLIVLASGCAKFSPSTATPRPETDQQFAQLGEEFLAGYLAWQPQTGTSLGFHEYDGKLADYSRDSLTREVERLKRFEQKLAALSTRSLSPRAYYDARILKAAIKNE